MARSRFDLTPYIKEEFLPNIEKEHNIEILLAVESGSRMWGFESPDSDYDIRFIYRRRDYREGLSVDGQNDVIHQDDPNPLIDADGWDVVKAVKLMAKGNGTIVDWLGSPIIYRANPLAVAQIEMLQYHLFSRNYIRHRFLGHHRGLIEKSLNEGAKRSTDNGTSIPAKKMLYAARSAFMLQCHIHILHANWGIPDPTMEGLLRVADAGWTGFKPDPIIFDSIRSIIEEKKNLSEKTALFRPEDHDLLWKFVTGNKEKNIPMVPYPEGIDRDFLNATVRALLYI